MNIKKLILPPLLLLGAIASAWADGTKDDPEVLNKYQFGADFQIKLTKGLKLNIEPELRYNGGYDKFLLSGGLTYKTFGCIYWGATYRLIVDRGESKESTSSSIFGFGDYESDTYHRYAFDVTYKDKFGRFTPSFRLRYNNFTDDGMDDREFLRYRAKVEYNIKRCKFTPSASVEAYQSMEENLLYKMRYSAGCDLKTGEKSSLSLDYKFDYFCLEYKNANIFSLGYKFKF
ncbi:MAG: DUF2490 domain-containing protein [Rikenellaceae bacterium]